MPVVISDETLKQVGLGQREARRVVVGGVLDPCHPETEGRRVGQPHEGGAAASPSASPTDGALLLIGRPIEPRSGR